MASNLVHFELPVPDTARGQAFYGQLLGWTFEDWQGSGYLMVAGAEPTGALMSGDGGHPVVYFATDDIDASVTRLRELGGQTDGPQEIPTVGRFAHCTDDQGTAFGLFQPAAA
jgi:uncharacterized protein